MKLAPKVRTLELQHTRLFNSTKKAFQFVVFRCFLYRSANIMMQIYKTLDAYGSHCLLGGGPTAAMQTVKMWLDAAAVSSVGTYIRFPPLAIGVYIRICSETNENFRKFPQNFHIHGAPKNVLLSATCIIHTKFDDTIEKRSSRSF